MTDGVQNGAVEFDLTTLRPTYRLVVGAPGGSQAFAIAQKLGLPKSLLESAKRRRSDQGAALDASLAAAASARIGADEARAMHAGDTEEATIHGQATREEAAALVAEGVPVAPLPFPVAAPDELN
mgnify:CR=1 FL=1